MTNVFIVGVWYYIRASMIAQPRNSIGKWLLAGVLLLIALCVVYPQVATLQGGLITGDHSEQHYPWAAALDTALEEGRLPWWTWAIHSGFPLLAEGQVGAFYPPNLLLHYLLPLNAAYSLNFLLHMFLSGLFMLLYCRGLRLGWPAAAMAVAAYLLGNAFGGAFYNITSLKTLCWFPLALWLIDRLHATRRWYVVFFLGVVFGLQLLVGYVQIAAYSIGISLLYLFLRGWVGGFDEIASSPESFRGTRNDAGSVIASAAKQSGRGNVIIAAGLWSVIAVAVAFAVFLPQFLATFPLSRLSARVGLDESFAYIGSFPPWGLVTLFFPKFEALIRTLGMYVGIAPLFLGVLAACRLRDPIVRRWVLLLAISLLLAMGGYSPLYVGLVKLTQFYSFRVPSKLLFFANTALAVLAGLGLQALLDGKVSQKAWCRSKRFFLGMVLIAVAGCLLGGWALETYRDPILRWGYAWTEQNIYNQPHHPHSLEHYQERVRSYFAMARELFAWGDRRTLFALVSLISVGLGIFVARCKWSPSALAGLFLFLAIGDLYAYSHINKLNGDLSTYQKELQVPASVEFLKKDDSLHRVFAYRGRFEGVSLIPGKNMLHGVDMIGAYAPFVLKAYRDLLADTGAVDDSTGRQIGTQEEMMRLLPLLSALNVKYVLTTKGTALGGGLQQVFADANEKIYLNPNARPRFFFAEGMRVQPDRRALLGEVRGMSPEETGVVWLEEQPPPEAIAGGQGTIQVVRHAPDRIVLQIHTKTGGLLFGSLLHYPTMRATLGRKPVPILRANYCFGAVAISPGLYTLVFSPAG